MGRTRQNIKGAFALNLLFKPKKKEVSVANRSDILQTINAGRVALGAGPLNSLPSGRKGSASSCPLANAFKDVIPGVTVGSKQIQGRTPYAHRFASAIGGEVASSNGDATITEPAVLRNFVRDFDDGDYPDLESFV